MQSVLDHCVKWQVLYSALMRQSYALGPKSVLESMSKGEKLRHQGNLQCDDVLVAQRAHDGNLPFQVVQRIPLLPAPR